MLMCAFIYLNLKFRTVTDGVKEMGLGKTLSLLALVCASIDMQTDQIASSQNGMCHGTLIITPKSSNC